MNTATMPATISELAHRHLCFHFWKLLLYHIAMVEAKWESKANLANQHRHSNPFKFTSFKSARHLFCVTGFTEIAFLYYVYCIDVQKISQDPKEQENGLLNLSAQVNILVRSLAFVILKDARDHKNVI